MGLGGLLKGIGKIAAPIAASAIPGIGPIAGPLVGAAMNRGGGGGGGIGGSMGRTPPFAGGGIGGPSGGPQMIPPRIQETMTTPIPDVTVGGGGFGGFLKKLAPYLGAGLGGFALGRMGGGGGGNSGMGMDNGPGNTGGWMPSSGGNMDMSNPNLQSAIMQGRGEALLNQPWRALGAPGNAGLGINPTMPSDLMNQAMNPGNTMARPQRAGGGGTATGRATRARTQ